MQLTNIKTTPLALWFLGVSFVLFQFFLQLSSGVIIGIIMHEMALSAIQAGLLASAFYYVYTTMQIPVGILFDSKSARFLLSLAAFLCAIGCFVFAHSYTFTTLFFGRLLIGAGSSFAFVGLSYILRQYFPLKHFGFLIGLSETLGFIITLLGIIGLSVLTKTWGWRSFMDLASPIALVISYYCWHKIPLHKNNPAKISIPLSKALPLILRSSYLWINGIFIGLSFSVITVFGAMWAIPFIQTKLACNLQQASFLDALLFLGAAISCPLFGYLDAAFKQRKLMMLFSCLSTAVLLFMVILLPISSVFFAGLILFLIGLCCGSYMIAFSISNELSPPQLLSTSTGFTNTLAMLSAPLLQPLIGYFLDLRSLSAPHYQLADYQWALLIIPFGLLVACSLIFLLPKKSVFP